MREQSVSWRRDESWPRIYAQLISTGEITEIARGPNDSYAYLRGSFTDFGPAWQIWIEFKRRVGPDDVFFSGVHVADAA